MNKGAVILIREINLVKLKNIVPWTGLHEINQQNFLDPIKGIKGLSTL